NPLMPLVLAPLDRLLAPGLGLVGCFRVGVLVTWGALVLSVLSLRSLARHVFAAAGMSADDLAAGSAAVLAFAAGLVALKGYYAMDAFLVLALGLAYLERAARLGPLTPGWRAALADGALLGGAVLARVDSVPLVASAFAMMLPQAARDAHVRPRWAAR